MKQQPKEYRFGCISCGAGLTFKKLNDISFEGVGCCKSPKYLMSVWGNHGKKTLITLSEYLSYDYNEKTSLNKNLEIVLNIFEDGEVSVAQDKSGLKRPRQQKEVSEVFTRRGQIEMFWKKQPFFYDRSKMFWLWNSEEFKWELSDEVDYLNAIQEKLGIETIDSKARIELVEGFKQIGRSHMPKPMEKTWVQFKDKIYDIVTGEVFEASPEYFITNPIPHKVGNSEETPKIDKLFQEWVGGNKGQLYEFMAYNLSQEKFMQRMFAFCGGGSNGKGTFIKLNYKFLGAENCVSTELKSLSEDKFEPAVLHRKLLAVMGEVSYSDLRNTNQIKKLAGEDKISFQFKGKTPFTDENTATGVCLTNSLPATPDKSLGFYRKWHIIDFPNQFKKINDKLLSDIEEVEFENLASKCLNILKRLRQSKEFTGEGDFEERMKRYEERSNPVMRFVEEFCSEEVGENWPLREFTNSCNEFLKSKHLRIMTSKEVGKVIREEGFGVSPRKIKGYDTTIVSIQNLKLLSKLSKLSKSELEPYKETNEKHASFDSYNSNSPKNPLKNPLGKDLPLFSAKEVKL